MIRRVRTSHVVNAAFSSYSDDDAPFSQCSRNVRPHFYDVYHVIRSGNTYAT